MLTGARIERQAGPPGSGPGSAGTETTVAVSGAFLMIGSKPASALLEGGPVQLGPRGHVVLEGRSQRTSVAGVYAAGQVADDEYRQAITASAEGARAAIDAERWLRTRTNTRTRTRTRSRAGQGESAPFASMARRSAQVAGPDGADGAAGRHAVGEAVAAPAGKPGPSPLSPPPPPRQEVTQPTCDLTSEDCIRQTVAGVPVVVFSKPWCPYCKRVRDFRDRFLTIWTALSLMCVCVHRRRVPAFSYPRLKLAGVVLI